MFHFGVQFTRESYIPARSEQVKLYEEMGSGSKDRRVASREPDDLNVHCAEYL